MKKFEAHELLNSVRCLLRNASLLSSLGPCDARKDFIKEIKNDVDKLLACCREADLPVSELAVKRLLKFFNGGLSEDAIAEAMEDAFSRAVLTMEDEMSSHTYFAVDPAEARAWSRKELLGKEVSTSFPSTDFEMREETRCYASRHCQKV
jgi:hypothetical protein